MTTLLAATLGAVLASAGKTPAAILAMSGGGVRIDFDSTVLLQMVLFSALVVVLKPLLFDPVLKVFEERERRTEGAKAEARTMQGQASDLQREYERAIERVTRAASQERERMRAETTRLEARILEEAAAASARILDDGRRKIDAEVKALRFELGSRSRHCRTP